MKLFSKRLLAVTAGAAALACVQTARAAPACRASNADLTAAIRAVHDKQKNVGGTARWRARPAWGWPTGSGACR